MEHSPLTTIIKRRAAMRTDKLYAIGGLFETSDQVMAATEKVTEKGYKLFDVNTPFPVHGLDHKMKLKPSTMGYFALAFGLAGAITALLLMTFTMVYDYPINIGGKPDFSLPAFIPVTFELTVLFAAIGTVFALLMVFFKFPDNAHPLHDTNYIQRCTTDHFGIYIAAEDKLFNESEVYSFLQSIGAKDIEKIYEYEEEKIPLLSKQFIGFLAISIIVVSGAGYLVFNKLMFMPPFNWMENQQRLDVESTSSMFADGFGMRNKVDGTILKSYMPDEFKADPDSAGKYLENPLVYNDKNIALGKKKFLTYCSPCHDNYAKGNSRLKEFFPKPPTLHSKKLREWSDGRIYHVITFGQGVMPSYASQVTKEERWAIIQYIRTLQRAFNPGEEDFEDAK
jgi:hypothetical protein